MKTKKTAFTLLELLVVIAILALLAAILFPVFARAREKARQSSCVSNARQIGLGIQQYSQDYDGFHPIYYAYNSVPSFGNAGHKGVEMQLQPYTKSFQIFKCPDDIGGPALNSEPQCSPGSEKNDSYAACYGTSYRFNRLVFSFVANESTQNNDVNGLGYFPLPLTTRLVSDSMFQQPAKTYIVRDEMMPWFSVEQDPNGARYGYNGPGYDYYRQWHSNGGTTIFADGHAKFIAGQNQFDKLWIDPEATSNVESGNWIADGG